MIRADDMVAVTAVMDAYCREQKSYVETVQELAELLASARADAFTRAAGLARRDGRADGLPEIFETLAKEAS